MARVDAFHALAGASADYDPLLDRWSRRAVIHIDETRAVEPLERTSEWEAGELPETYPWAVQEPEKPTREILSRTGRRRYGHGRVPGTGTFPKATSPRAVAETAGV